MNTTRKGTTTWVAIIALLMAAMMIGGISLFALEEFFPTLRGSVVFLVAIITVVLFVFFLVLRRRRVREMREAEPVPVTGSDATSAAAAAI